MNDDAPTPVLMTFSVNFTTQNDPDAVVEKFRNLPPGVTPLMAATGIMTAPDYIEAEDAAE
jgi:hypothetical protein